MHPFTLRAGSVPGRDHQLRQTNCQDKYGYAELQVASQPYLAGIVCDGCSEGKHSEVGAALLAEFLLKEIKRLLEAGSRVEEVPVLLYENALTFLQGICERIIAPQTEDSAGLLAFTRDYLLATVLGLIVGEEQTVIFAAGDGLIIVNDQLHVRDEQNTPDYLAYGLLESSQLQAQPASGKGFDLILLQTAQLERLAIWTDGFLPELSEETWKLGGPRSLQRRLNIWAKQKLFIDDTTGITVERVLP
ncbi:MAG TPA: protein phosphatase 2C domain-containing protein [Chloroflexia bacterium]|nr:protein phosphatase 2C domain-containing protein [Chloroflexia bacterium]